MTEQIVRGRGFRNNIRKYNSAFTFTFCNFRANIRINNRINRDSIFFQIHGELYHLQDFFRFFSDTVLVFAQLYFYDSDDATVRRHERHSDLNVNLLRQLTNMLYECNLFISIYKIVDEFIRSNEIFENELRIILNPQMRLIMKTETDRRRVNFFTSNEIAVIIPYEQEEVCGRDIVLAARQNGLKSVKMHRINQNHAVYMSLHYVLLFSCGEYGYHYELRLLTNFRNREKLRMPQQIYYRYRLHIRNAGFSILHHVERFFQQYVVDVYVSCDLNRTT